MSDALAPSSDAFVTSSFLFLVVRPGAPSSVLAPNSLPKTFAWSQDAICSF